MGHLLLYAVALAAASACPFAASAAVAPVADDAATATAAVAPVAAATTAAAAAQEASEPLAFPGAQGWAAHTRGGRGGRILRVTTLAARGPGSLLEALDTPGPRIIVFEVGGVIDLQGEEIDIREPYLTIAGQTAPSPGITLIRTGVNIRAHDVIIRHIRVRTGTAGMAKRHWEPDAMGTVGAYNVIVDHCSLTWSIDENLRGRRDHAHRQCLAGRTVDSTGCRPLHARRLRRRAALHA